MKDKKPLKDFTKDEYNRLMATGMLFEFYPEATGDYLSDCEVMEDYEEYLDNVDRS